MSTPESQSHRFLLRRITHRVMCERGLSPDFSVPALAELAAITGPSLLAVGLDKGSPAPALVLD